ncbi:hypothetical protein FQZ97_890670 [compost metagenome]
MRRVGTDLPPSSPVRIPWERANRKVIARKATTVSINTSAIAPPNGQLLAMPNWEAITVPTIVPFNPPTMEGVM